jgi:hypothetical protein
MPAHRLRSRDQNGGPRDHAAAQGNQRPVGLVECEPCRLDLQGNAIGEVEQLATVGPSVRSDTYDLSFEEEMAAVVERGYRAEVNPRDGERGAAGEVLHRNGDEAAGGGKEDGGVECRRGSTGIDCRRSSQIERQTPGSLRSRHDMDRSALKQRDLHRDVGRSSKAVDAQGAPPREARLPQRPVTDDAGA